MKRRRRRSKIARHMTLNRAGNAKEVFRTVANEHRSPTISNIIEDAESAIDTMISRPTECKLFNGYVRLFRSGISLLLNLEPGAAAVDQAAITAIYDIHSEATAEHSPDCLITKAMNNEPLD